MNPTGDIAHRERNLILIAVALMLLIVVPVLITTVVFAWRYRQGNRNKVYDPHFHHSTKLELAVWSGPLIIVFILGIITLNSTYQLDPFRPLDRISATKPLPANVKPLEVQVVALDWKWLFIYPEQGIATINELALPVDVPVHFSITSESQFNTFYAPTLAGMIYAMPGMKSQLNAVLNEAGDSWGYSGNYTGWGFSDMRFKLSGKTSADFDQWVASVKSGGGALNAADYLVLEHPTEKVPVTHYATVQSDLFDRAVNDCVAPGRPCTADILAYDKAHAAGAKVPAPSIPQTPTEAGVGSRVFKTADTASGQSRATGA